MIIISKNKEVGNTSLALPKLKDNLRYHSE